MKRLRLLVVLGSILVVFAIPSLVFFNRSPVIIVTDALFAALYGSDRIQQQRVSASLALFRQVKPVMIADGASPDLVAVAISSASSLPFCVLFPRHQSQAAEIYHEQFPEIPTILIGGHTPATALPSPDDSFFVYSTDSETDMYRAGLLAGIISGTRQNLADEADEITSAQDTAVLWQDHFVTEEQRNLFLRGAREQYPGLAIIFARTIYEIPVTEGLSCLVLTSAGAEYLENQPRMPIILFSWLDPKMASGAVFAVFDDSPWGLAVPAARMAGKKQAECKIPSKPLIISGNIADNSIFRMLRESVEKTP